MGDPIPHPTIKGIYTKKYRVPSYDGKGNVVSNSFKEIPEPKTIYDPNIISDKQMMD